MARNDYFFIREIARILSNTGHETLSFLFQREQAKQSILSRYERAQLKDEIINDIMLRIHATVDVTEIVQEIDELRNSIERSGK